MSKSKGNVIEPRKILEDYGADAIRYWAAGSKLGEDFDFQEKDIITGKKTINKLLNASNFVFMNLNDYKPNKNTRLELIDELLLNKLNDLVIELTNNFEKYEYSKARLELEKFFWNVFSSNYLEIVKKRIYNESGNRKISAQFTLYHSLFTILKLMAPIMPFVTEEIYQKYYKKNEKTESIHLTKWPETKKIKESNNLDLFIDVLSKIRQEKSLKQKPMNSEIILTITKKDKDKLKKLIKDLQEVSNAKEIKEGEFKVEFV
jgi:valyl-tRNA synthetase